ncbi:MAG: ParB N-terminal domain-containing protein [Candidatus Aminicenantes bacterium]|nr:ParB N-terminal domain-containing protein [Candidatus Aminicenantes bacterium]NIM79945.1 ParB N-terminal domain-containing protein [Candidatus Aminicenantes bacterium]NIN19284.1 ParB N-terminal domain-containing protein [Candidatus Aminicenantes bacterium]NIN43187.1 ParB N-terminal domain-containing protein [Candidatus Aminicenantes bacterium]NIN85926.1 ParB N-terminal domain-containing protein [Candidatus Aminicenantes bacterium]
MMKMLATDNNSPVIQLPLSKLDLRLKRLRSASKPGIEEMKLSFENYGQITPVIVVAEGPVYILVDGFKRYMAAELLKMNGLSTMVLDCDRAIGKAHMYLLNKSSDFNFIEECLLVLELVEKEGFNQVEVASILGKHKSWVNRRLQIIRSLSEQVIEDIKLGLLPGGSAASLARLPCETQADFDRLIQSYNLKPQECNRLIDLWCKADDVNTKEFLMKLPKKALEIYRVAGKGGVDVDSDSQYEKLPRRTRIWFTLLESLGRVARSLGKHSQKWLNVSDEKIHGDFCKKLEEVEDDCQQAFSEARKALSGSGSPISANVKVNENVNVSVSEKKIGMDESAII